MIQLLVMAKAPVPGRVKTRLCPPCTPQTAAAIAAAALADTLRTAIGVPAVRRTLVLDGDHPVPLGWACVPQRGTGLGERLAAAFADTALPGVPSLLIGMDTPQLTGRMLRDAAAQLCRTPAVLGPADDGGWWALGLHDATHAAVLPQVPMSTATTGEHTLAALHGRGLRPALLPRLRDVDTAADAVTVAAACPPGARFPAAVARWLPAGNTGKPPAVVARPMTGGRTGKPPAAATLPMTSTNAGKPPSMAGGETL
ncbi:TIGR04282 family arsenosugar biosynthesis glycosyltransferase [Actinoplanes sp. NBC_00393]|uniref:TIGR04282 family arsenosugar biosynthesis glycosyltransferase n=1 Tax=Actinoplanes sp. NBC_00393 TaxID=2975953 RepID=UPI002E22C445